MRDWRKNARGQDGPAAVRHAVGGLSRGRRQGADPHHLRLSLARHQRHAAPPLRSGVAQTTASTRRARRSTSTSPASRSRSCAPAALRLQGGGVGYYPTSGSPFVHLDVGNVRHWPRMTRDQLVKVFPDGRTVHVPTDGNPLPGYELAHGRHRARREPRTVASPQKRSFLASLFRPRQRMPKRSTTTPRPRDRSRCARHVRQVRTSAKPAPVRRPLASSSPPPPNPWCPRRPCRCRRGVRCSRSHPPKSAGACPRWNASPPLSRAVDRRFALAEPDRQHARPAGTACRRAADRRSWPKPTRLAYRARAASQTASAARDVTASVGPFPNQDRVPPDLALAYAAQAEAGRGLPASLPSARPSLPPSSPAGAAASIASKPVDLVTSACRASRNAWTIPGCAASCWHRACRIRWSSPRSASPTSGPRPVHGEARLVGADDVLATIRISA